MSVDSDELASAVAKEFGEVLQCAGVEIVVVDNYKNTQSRVVTELTTFCLYTFPPTPSTFEPLFH